ncbi:ABC transporter ATP-binding protein [Roseisalinus antarcticus]|uniref:sn-glycerol-3-phosphate import ATP-binding protein UgpC n=1 Tax=Roseisalinus antarcticus TaxID=254357 RepID=A0A1Y5TWU5_9RHOB|nr:sn-glycerol-3-phosphate ABC transporter ATP-binding protein UgpC [Roseisalinus antarcticus]SLN74297.1 sn-glycerol-3-phosphate import ATP-binding protein UgpC [Roseisalinus antarcticus]
MSTMTLRNVCKSFGSVEVIRDVSLEVDDGEFVILVGPSGCGKSTLLRMIAGLEDVTSGDLAIDNRRITNVPPKDRDIAMVFQNYALYPHMTVAQNMGYSLKLAGWSRADIDKTVGETAESLGLGPLLGRFPKELSGGQRQRVATGRAIVRNPKVFLFDEPLSNLDAKLRVQMRSEIRDLQKRLGVTSIYVTHDQVEAMTMADRIVVLHDGLIEQVGAPLDLYDRPANLFVATFIGSPSMNLLKGEASAGEIVLKDGGTLPAPAGTPDGPVTVGYRPDAIGIGAEGDRGGLSATVRTYEAMGNETIVFAETGGRELTVVTRDRPSLERGKVMTLVPDTARAHVFGSDGRRLN